MQISSYMRRIMDWIHNLLSYKHLVVYIGQVSTYAAYFVNRKVVKEFFVSSNNIQQVQKAIHALPKFYKLNVIYDNSYVTVHHSSFSNVNFNENNVLKVMRNHLPKEALIWSRFEIRRRHEILPEELVYLNTAVLDFHYFEEIASYFNTTEILDGIYFSSFIILRLLQKADVKLNGKFLVVVTINYTTGISVLAIENGIIVLRKIVQLEHGRSSEYIYGQCKHTIESILLTFKTNIEQLSLEARCMWILSKKHIDVFRHAKNDSIVGADSKIIPEIVNVDCVEKYISAFLLHNKNTIKSGKNSIMNTLAFAQKLKSIVYTVLGGVCASLLCICILLLIDILVKRAEVTGLKMENEKIAQEYTNIVNNIGFGVRNVNSIIKLHSIVSSATHSDRIDFSMIDHVSTLAAKVYRIEWKRWCDSDNQKPCYQFNCGFDHKLLYECKGTGASRIKELLSQYDYDIIINPKQAQFNGETCRLLFKCQKK